MFYLTKTCVNESELQAQNSSVSHQCLKLVISGPQAHTHAHILMSLACRLIEIWAWIIHAWLMSLGNLLTLNSRLVDLNLWCVKCICCIVAEVKTEINNLYRC